MPYIHEYFPKGGDKEFLVFAFDEGTVDIDCYQWDGSTSINFSREEVQRLVDSLQTWLNNTWSG